MALLHAWASIVGWTEGQVPPTFWDWGDRLCFVPPYFLKRICVSFCGCVYCNFCYNCYLAKTVNQLRAKSSLFWLMSVCLWLLSEWTLCPYCYIGISLGYDEQ